MITLLYNPEDKNHLKVKDELDALCLRYKTILSSDHMEIHEYDKVVKGAADIKEYLEELSAFYADWYDFRCDKWDKQ